MVKVHSANVYNRQTYTVEQHSQSRFLNIWKGNIIQSRRVANRLDQGWGTQTLTQSTVTYMNNNMFN